jgi:hypothetical protein
MAESIIIHFNECNPAAIISRIETRFGASDRQAWRFPADDYLICVRPYSCEDFDAENEAAERDDISFQLAGSPNASFDFEIRRSRSDDACDLLEQFVRVDLQGLTFIVDDMRRLISCKDLEGITDFLDCYRYKRLADHLPSLSKLSANPG